ncbi:unnamed protein product [Schistosoma rodhaini]|uniref:Uncharacterized protein n=1 Tax=Schistosoma rodhaini TaxID=6188 RepID=A0AA85GIV6_9TREM|nr:unnamed protein product [Schistosoma rodhaini]CAH8485924.1 unnamed protein product [Schistosoma rodhaini]
MILLTLFFTDQIQSIKCHVCDYCPIVTNKSISNENCTSCAVAGANYSVHRICLRNNTIPTNFPTENRDVCYLDLCNNGVIGGKRNDSISCYTSLDCENITIYIIIEGVGRCMTTHSSGITSKFCGSAYNQLDHEYTIDRCSTNRCNRMTKLSIHRHVTIVLFVCIAISKYIL